MPVAGTRCSKQVEYRGDMVKLLIKSGFHSQTDDFSGSDESFHLTLIADIDAAARSLLLCRLYFKLSFP